MSQYSYEDILFDRFSSDGYVFNPRNDSKTYKRQLEFKTTVLEAVIDYSWIEETLDEISRCLNAK